MGASGLGAKRQARAATSVSLDGLQRDCRSFWLDSGAHSLYNLHCYRNIVVDGKIVDRKFKHKDVRYKWYSKDGHSLTRAFVEYLDLYAAFVKEYKNSIDYYATVDVIYNPKLSWESINYLKSEHGINPVPVIHHRTPLKWVERYLEAGYTYIGLGGLGQQSTKHDYYEWADSVYNFICSNKDRTPCVKTHGFAMTSYELLLRYPWWSVDSSSAYKVAGFGGIYIPHKRNGKFTFEVEPYIIAFSHRSTAKAKKGKHYDTLNPKQKAVVREWLEEIDIPLGAMGDNEQVLEYGVTSEYNARALANLRFFQKLCEFLPKWPWSFKVKPKSTFFKAEDIR